MTKKKRPEDYEKLGAPRKLDDVEIRAKFLAAASLDANTEACCAYAGISKNTYYEYIKAEPSFQDEIDACKQKPYLQAVKVVVQALQGKNPDPNFALKYLERKAKKEFSPRSEITGADGKPLIGGFAGMMLEANQILEENGESI